MQSIYVFISGASPSLSRACEKTEEEKGGGGRRRRRRRKGRRRRKRRREEEEEEEEEEETLVAHLLAGRLTPAARVEVHASKHSVPSR